MTIHPTSIVEDGAKLGDGVEIGPFCHVGAQVTLGEGVILKSHVVVNGHTNIGAHTRIYPFASLGYEPQDLKYRGEDTTLTIGADCVIREGVTMSPGTVTGRWATIVGDRCFFLANSHVGHDSHIGSDCVFTNNVMVAGHVTIGSWVICGGGAAIVQYARVGNHAFVSGMTGIGADLIPFGLAFGSRGFLMGLNLVGLKRRNFSREAIHDLRRAYRALFAPEGTLKERVEDVAEEFVDNAEVMMIVDFIRAGADRALCLPEMERFSPVSPRVALVCGGGQFPLVAARAAQQRGLEVFILGLKGMASEAIQEFPHVWLGVGQLGAALKEISARDIKDVCLIGGLGRPEFSDLRLDWGAIKRLPDIFRLFNGGDDHALKGVIRLFEHEGLRVIGVDSLAPELLAAAGAMNALPFPKALAEDLAFGHDCLTALSAYDCGQTLVLAKRRIIAIEAAEGTDSMLLRVAELRDRGRWRAKGPAGLLVKAPKKGQDLRVDLPAMGPETVASAARAGLAGIAVEAGRVLILDRAAVAAQAEKAGLFLYGFSREAKP